MLTEIQSKQIITDGKKIKKATAKGNILVQAKLIIWSHRTIGKVALNQTKRKQNKHAFKAKIKDCTLKKLLFKKIIKI